MKYFSLAVSLLPLMHMPCYFIYTAPFCTIIQLVSYNIQTSGTQRRLLVHWMVISSAQCGDYLLMFKSYTAPLRKDISTLNHLQKQIFCHIGSAAMHESVYESKRKTSASPGITDLVLVLLQSGQALSLLQYVKLPEDLELGQVFIKLIVWTFWSEIFLLLLTNVRIKVIYFILRMLKRSLRMVSWLQYRNRVITSNSAELPTLRSLQICSKG